jgi:hypothetical protein
VISLADLLKLIPPLGILGAALYWVLQRHLEGYLARRLETTKHELQLEHQKKSIVFEHQKDSFRKVLIAVHRAIEAIRSGPGPGWYPISPDQVDEFRRVVSEESLFLDPESGHALRIFEQAMWMAAAEPAIGAEPSDDEMQRANTQTAFISERLSEHFRASIGLITDSNSLSEVELLGACQLVNRHKSFFRVEGALAFRKGETAHELVVTARRNLDLVLSELERLKKAIRSDKDRAASFFDVCVEVDMYLKKLADFEAIPTVRRKQAGT